MRILIHSLNFSPELTGTGRSAGEMASWLASRGHQIRVVTAPPFYPEWRVRAEYSSWRYEINLNGHSPRNLGVIRCPLWVPKTHSARRRLLHLASFAASSWPAVLGHVLWRPDIVIVIEPSLFCAPAALAVARLSGAKAWLHIQDFEIDAAFELGLMTSPALQKCALAVERFILKRCHKVSTISEKMVERLEKKGVASSDCVLFPNSIDTDAVFPLPTVSPLRRELEINDSTIVALYSGNMGEKQGLHHLAEAARCLASRSDIHFVFCGAGTFRTKLVSLVGTLPSVTFLPLQPDNRLNDLFNLADIHLLPQREDISDLVMPGKLREMLASGRPVVATARPETQIAICVQGRGLIVPPGDSSAIASAICHLAADADLRRRMGEEGRKYAVKHLSRERLMQQFERSLTSVCDRSTTEPSITRGAIRND
jgi:colanic acid biosynthesis glycosyl transferase WcaI